MREHGLDRSRAMDTVRLKRLIDVCDSKENTLLYLVEVWEYEPQVSRYNITRRLERKKVISLKETEKWEHKTPIK